MSDRLSKSLRTALVAFGSNTGDRDANIRKALDLVREIPETNVLEVSAFREYPAEGVFEPQPDFLNGVCGNGKRCEPVAVIIHIYRGGNRSYAMYDNVLIIGVGGQSYF